MWLPIVELDALNEGGPIIVQKHTWGLDLAGQSESVGVSPAFSAIGVSPAFARLGVSPASADGAASLTAGGGIGGLLATFNAGSPGTTGVDVSYIFCYDAHGNVGQLVDLSAETLSAGLVGRYEYDVYGNVTGPDENENGDWLEEAGPQAAAKAYRFSTKSFDADTGMGDWGYRWYDPRTGRWVSWDPIGERGGRNLYRFVRNAPPVLLDATGLDPDGTPADEWWENWVREHPELSEPKLQEYRRAFDHGCIGLTQIHIGTVGFPKTTDCWGGTDADPVAAYERARARQKEMIDKKSCKKYKNMNCEESQPRIFLIRFYSGGKKPFVGEPTHGGRVPNMSEWIAHGTKRKLPNGETAFNYDYGFLADSGLWLDANEQKPLKGPNTMRVYEKDFQTITRPLDDFDSIVFCVHCEEFGGSERLPCARSLP